MNCPKCNKNLIPVDFRDILDPETGGGDSYIKCSKCGYDELEEESERIFEELFA